MGDFDLKINGNYKVNGNLKQLRDEIETTYASIPANIRHKLDFDMSALFSFDYSNPNASGILLTIYNNLIFQKKVYGSNNEFLLSQYQQKLDAEAKWLALGEECVKLEKELSGINPDENPDKHAAVKQKLDETIYDKIDAGRRYAQQTAYYNKLSMLG